MNYYEFKIIRKIGDGTQPVDCISGAVHGMMNNLQREPQHKLVPH